MTDITTTVDGDPNAEVGYLPTGGGEIPSIYTGTNAALILACAALGYIEGKTLDATYGRGAFWTLHRPLDLTTNDLHADGTVDYGFDFRRLGFDDGEFLTVVFDPPYKLNGTPVLGEQDARYGTDTRMNRDEVMALIRDGARECYRVTARWLLVKCQDQVEGGKMRWQTDMVTRAIEDLGGRKVDRFDLLGNVRPQPPGRQQRTARHTASQLLVFRKPRTHTPSHQRVDRGQGSLA